MGEAVAACQAANGGAIVFIVCALFLVWAVVTFFSGE